jgi:hypothetical protein
MQTAKLPQTAINVINRFMAFPLSAWHRSRRSDAHDLFESKTKTLPSPILPVFAAFDGFDDAIKHLALDRRLTFTLGRKSTTHRRHGRAPCVLCRPKPLTSVTVIP